MTPITLVAIERDGTLGIEIDLSELIASVCSANQQMYDRTGFHPPWIGYIAFEGDTPVGTCAFKSAPSSGRSELAYFTFPPFEGRGIATRMAQRLIEIAHASDPSIVVTAQTLIERNSSHRVLEKNSFVQCGIAQDAEVGSVLEWKRTLP